jgi:nicotinamidase-related amidase
MPFYPVVSSKTALIVYDMTRDVVDEGGHLHAPRAKEVVARLVPLIKRCRGAGMPVIFLRQVLAADGSDAGLLDTIYPGFTAVFRRGAPGTEIPPALGMQPQDWLIDKNRFSAFWGTGLHDRLLQRGIDTVIITGCSTAVGCETTARDAATRDIKAIVASDGMVTRPLRDLGWGAFSEDEVHRMTLTVLAQTFARVASIEEILKEIP